MDKITVSAVVLAAGKSSRMGSNKLFMPIENKPILWHVLTALTKCDFCEVTVVFETPEVQSMAKKFGFGSVRNDHSHMGQSSSIVLGVANTKTCDGIIFIIGDQPFLSAETLTSMIDMFRQNPDCFIASALEGKRCSPVIFPYACKNDLLNLKGDAGGRKILNAGADKILLYECANPMECFDVDTYSDYEEALNYIAKNK